MNDQVKVEFDFFVVRGSVIAGSWSWAACLNPDDADRLAEQLHSAAHVARTIKQASEKLANGSRLVTNAVPPSDQTRKRG